MGHFGNRWQPVSEVDGKSAGSEFEFRRQQHESLGRHRNLLPGVVLSQRVLLLSTSSIVAVSHQTVTHDVGLRFGFDTYLVRQPASGPSTAARPTRPGITEDLWVGIESLTTRSSTCRDFSPCGLPAGVRGPPPEAGSCREFGASSLSRTTRHS
jgi:hypothetical protein